MAGEVEDDLLSRIYSFFNMKYVDLHLVKTSNCHSYAPCLNDNQTNQSHGNCYRMVEAKRKDKDLI